MIEQNSKSTVDFSKMTNDELSYAFKNINKDLFPANFEACKAEIAYRKETGSTGPVLDKSEVLKNENKELKKQTRRFFRDRFFASVVDSLIIITVAHVVLLFSDVLNRVGLIGLLGFFTLSFFYIFLMDGSIGQGQTFGKKLFKLKVVGEGGRCLSKKETSLRGLFFVGLGLYSSQIIPMYSQSMALIIFNFLLNSLAVINLLFIVKHPQHRSLMDIISNALIIKNDSAVPTFIGFSGVQKFKGWFIVVSLFLVSSLIYLTYAALTHTQFDSDHFQYMLKDQTHLNYTGSSVHTLIKGAEVRMTRTFTFSLSPKYLADEKVVAEQSAKARELILSRDMLATPENLVVRIQGIKFSGLYPAFVSYPNWDLYKKDK